MSDRDGLEWTEIKGIAPGDRIQCSITRHEDGYAVVDAYRTNWESSYNGCLKMSLSDHAPSVGQDIMLQVTDLGEPADEFWEDAGSARTIQVRWVTSNDTVQGPEFDIKLVRPSPNQLFDEVWGTVKYGELEENLPVTVSVNRENEYDIPAIERNGMEIEIPDASVGETVTITDVHVYNRWDREIIEGSAGSNETTSPSARNGPSTASQSSLQGSPELVKIERVSGSGNMIGYINNNEVNFGPLDCSPGTMIHAQQLTPQFWICLDREYWSNSYLDQVDSMVPGRLPETVPQPPKK